MRLGAGVVMDRSGRVGGRSQEARHQCTIHYIKVPPVQGLCLTKKYEVDTRSARLLIGLLTKHDPRLHAKPASRCMEDVMTFSAPCRRLGASARFHNASAEQQLSDLCCAVYCVMTIWGEVF